MKKILRITGWLFLGFLAILVIWSALNYKLVGYGIQQFRGQWHIVSSSVPLDKVLADPQVPDSIKEKIRFIRDVAVFAMDSLGLKPTPNYTTYYDQKGKPVLWVLTASEAFRIKAVNWHFPVLGDVSYKGFFNYDNGLKEDSSLRSQGYDTDYGEVSAWSTLGWFKDPVLSGMLNRSRGRLAELIIHEMTHATLYVKSSVNFNENLASVIGEAGARQFLSVRYGKDSDVLRNYEFQEEDYNTFSRFMLTGKERLDSLYNHTGSLDRRKRSDLKQAMITAIVRSLDTLSFHNPERYCNLYSKHLPNNAYFLNVVRYDAQKDSLKADMQKESGGNIREYMRYLSNKFGK